MAEVDWLGMILALLIILSIILIIIAKIQGQKVTEVLSDFAELFKGGETNG